MDNAGAVANSAHPAAMSAVRSVAGLDSSNAPAKNAADATIPEIISTIQPVGEVNALRVSRLATAVIRRNELAARANGPASALLARTAAAEEIDLEPWLVISLPPLPQAIQKLPAAADQWLQ